MPTSKQSTKANNSDFPAKSAIDKNIASKKRSAPTDNDDAASDVSDLDPTLTYTAAPRWNANEVRRKIDTFMRNTGMTQKAFYTKIAVSDKSFRSFMSQSGASTGTGSATYSNAIYYFSKREDRGLKMPRAKKQKTTAADTKQKEHAKVPDVADMPTLDGEETGSVKIYDTCQDIRQKFDAHLRKTGMTKAAFARELSKCLGTDGGAVNANQVTEFQRKKGPLSGNSSKAVYAGYVYFEKQRLKEGKAKSKKREEMEKVHGKDGVWTDHPFDSTHFWCKGNERPHVDKYGLVDFF